MAQGLAEAGAAIAVIRILLLVISRLVSPRPGRAFDGRRNAAAFKR
jgi:hypothetical protein